MSRIEQIKKLREETGASVMDCRDALEEAKQQRLEKLAVVNKMIEEGKTKDEILDELEKWL